MPVTQEEREEYNRVLEAVMRLKPYLRSVLCSVLSRELKKERENYVLRAAKRASPAA